MEGFEPTTSKDEPWRSNLAELHTKNGWYEVSDNYTTSKLGTGNKARRNVGALPLSYRPHDLAGLEPATSRLTGEVTDTTTTMLWKSSVTTLPEHRCSATGNKPPTRIYRQEMNSSTSATVSTLYAFKNLCKPVYAL